MLKKVINSIRQLMTSENLSEKTLPPDAEAFLGLGTLDRFVETSIELRIIRGEDTPTTGFDAHYIYHPAWAARILAQTRPTVHTDISSTLQFCSLVSAFVPVEFYDYRPAPLSLANLSCGKADLTQLHFASGSIASLSCMHTVEHIGLGRYGDPLDPDGDLKAMAELKRVLASGGNLIFVVPVGKPKIVFNAHRIYSYRMIEEAFAGLKVESFALITDAGDFLENADPALVEAQSYGCGCFWFKKPLT